jgi:serine/threonine protein kinase/WD40 repeat protein
MSNSDSEHDNLLDQLAEEFAARFRRGERPALEEYTDRYPELADDIRELFPALVKVEQVEEGHKKDESDAKARDPARSLEQIGDYRIVGEIGRGGMGVVYEAEQVSLGRRVALKVLPRHGAADRLTLERFRREARAAARLHHTNIVPVFEIGQDRDVRFYAMQFIQGQSLDGVITELRHLRIQSQSKGNGDDKAKISSEARSLSPSVAHSLLTGGFLPEVDASTRSRIVWEPTSAQPAGAAIALAKAAAVSVEATEADPLSDLAPSSSSSSPTPISWAVLPGGTQLSVAEMCHRVFHRSVAQIGRQAASALAHAHGRGVIHRDVKPSNLLLDTDGVVWVTDFGLAKADDDGLTQTGDVLGTIRYMAPERFSGQADARSDVYALGLSLYELLVLRPAFDSPNRLALIDRVKNVDPPRPRSIDPRIPLDLETIVLKAVEKDPKARYASADAMSEDLRRFLADEPIRARRQTQLERYVRWARHHPGIAVLGGVLTAVLSLATVASLLAAGYFNRAARSERAARQEADLLRQAESSQRQRAETERKRADVTLADMYTSRGLLAAERDAPAEAVLWFAAAADQSASAEDSVRQAHNRLRARNWMRRATLPVGAMSCSADACQLDFQPRGDLLLVRSGNGDVIFWSWRDDKRLAWAENLLGIGAAQFSPDGASVALGFLSGEVQIRKVTDGKLLAHTRHPGQIKALAFSSDGKFLAIASDSARVWDIRGQAFLKPIWSHPRPVSALAFNRKGDRLITVCDDKLVRVFAMESTQGRVAPLFAPVIHAVASSPALVDRDRFLVTVEGGSQLSRWDMATGRRALASIHTKAWMLQGVVASPDGIWFATGGFNGPELYSADSSQPPVHLSHTNLVKRFVFSPDSTMLLSVSWDSSARLWALPDGRALGPPLKHMTNVEQCAWSHDSRHLATAQRDGLIRVWQRPLDDLVLAKEHGWGERPRVSFDGRLVVPGLWHESPNLSDGHQNVTRLRAVATASGQPAGPAISLPGSLVDSCVCGDNLAVAVALSRGEKGQLCVWDLATSRARFEPINLPGLPVSVAARPGSGQLAVICSTGDLLVVDDQTGKAALKLRHQGWTAFNPQILSPQASYSPDGKTLVSLGPGTAATVNVRDADTGQLRFAPLHPSLVGSAFRSFSISADSQLIATMAVARNAAQIWDLATGRALSQSLPHPGDVHGLFSVRFSPNGRYLLTGHKDGQDRYWDWRAAKFACPPIANDNESHDVAITPDGRFALTVVGGRPELHISELTTGRRIAPPVRVALFDGGWCLTLAITPDGQRALVSFSGSAVAESTASRMDLAVVDLEPLLSRCSTPTADLALLAELATARHIELGDLSGLTTDRWQERWSLLRARNPDLARSFLFEPSRPGRVTSAPPNCFATPSPTGE